MRTIQGHNEIGQRFTTYHNEAEDNIFKLGVLSNYKDEDASASLQAWEAGDVKESMRLAFDDPDSRYSEWIRFRRQNPVLFRRVQIVDFDQPSAYTDWQLGIAAGFQERGVEEAYTVEYAKLIGSVALPNSDLLTFDDNRALQWLYVPGSHGEVAGGRIWDASQGDKMHQLLAIQHNVLMHAQRLE